MMAERVQCEICFNFFVANQKKYDLGKEISELFGNSEPKWICKKCRKEVGNI